MTKQPKPVTAYCDRAPDGINCPDVRDCGLHGCLGVRSRVAAPARGRRKKTPVWITVTTQVPPSLHRRLVAAAADFGIPLEQYIGAVLVDAVEPSGAIAEEPGDFE
jgi:hypothetical protein